MSRDLSLIYISNLLWGVGEGLFFHFNPLYLSELGADPVEIGGILGVASIAFAVVHIPAGALADRWGRKPIIVAAFAIGTCTGAIMFFSRSLALFVVGLTLYNATYFVSSPLSSYVTAGRGSIPLVRALTMIAALYSLGAMVGPILGGLIADQLGLRTVYGIATLVFACSTGVITIIRRQEIEPVQRDSNYRALLSNDHLKQLFPLAFIAMFALYLSWPLTPNFLQEQRGVSLSEIGFFGSLYSLGIMILSLILGSFNARVGFLLTQVGAGFSVVMLWRGLGVPWYAAGYFLAGGYRTARSLVTAQVEGLVQRSQLGLAYGFSETVMGLVQVAAAPVAGVLYQMRPCLPFPVSLGLIAISIGLTAYGLPRLGKESISGKAQFQGPSDPRI